MYQVKIQITWPSRCCIGPRRRATAQHCAAGVATQRQARARPAPTRVLRECTGRLRACEAVPSISPRTQASSSTLRRSALLSWLPDRFKVCTVPAVPSADPAACLCGAANSAAVAQQVQHVDTECTANSCAGALLPLQLPQMGQRSPRRQRVLAQRARASGNRPLSHQQSCGLRLHLPRKRLCGLPATARAAKNGPPPRCRVSRCSGGWKMLERCRSKRKWHTLQVFTS